MSFENDLGAVIACANAGDMERAWNLCRQVEAAYPAQPAVHQLLAVLSMQRGHPKEAGDYAQESLALRPNHVPTLMVAGDAARSVGATNVAAAHYTRAHLLQPDRSDICLALGVAQYQSGQLLPALNALERCIHLAPESLDAWFNLALVRQDMQDFHGAIAALNRLLVLCPTRVDALVNLGIVLQANGQMDDAFLVYGRAYRLQSDTFGRIAHALAAEKTGRMWLDLDDLRTALLGSEHPLTA